MTTAKGTGTEDNHSGIGGTVSDAAGTIASAASDAVDRLPDLAEATRSTLVEVDRQVSASSDELLTVGTALSFGMATGLLLAGANRLLVLATFVPAVLLGLRLLDRTSRSRSSRASGSAGAKTGAAKV